MGLVHFEDGHVVYYPYTPSKVAGFTFMVLFAIATLVHLLFMFKFRTWYFIPLVLGGITETFGHYGRGWAADKPNSPRPFMLQLMLILVSPVFIVATIYATLSKFNRTILERPKRRCGSSVIFIIIDICAFCTQIGGGLVQITGDRKLMEIGDNIVLGGLIFQLVALAVYLLLVFRFRQHAQRNATVSANWQKYVWVLVGSVIAIWVRNLVRVIEFAQGFYGFISQNEAMLYMFDSFLMLSVMSLFAIFHPGRLLNRLIIGGRLQSLEAEASEVEMEAIQQSKGHRPA